MVTVSEQLRAKINSAIVEKGFLLYYIDQEIIGGQTHLVIYINKEGYDFSISLDDCVEITRSINEFIDDYIDDEYILEISSSGINRRLYTLEHLQEALGHKIKVQLRRKVEGIESKKIEGVLKKIENETLYLDEFKFIFDDIKKANYIGSEDD